LFPMETIYPFRGSNSVNWGPISLAGCAGNRRPIGTRIGEQTGLTWVQGFTSYSRPSVPALGRCSCSFSDCSLLSRLRVKRSRALRGRNPTRDNPADGVPMALVPSRHAGGRGHPLLPPGHRTLEPSLRKSHRSPSRTLAPAVSRSSCPS
jgi:hypothetical protein